MMKDVNLRDILKLHEADIIYPIPDSNWVIPIHVVLKKTYMTILENDKGEMVPMSATVGTCGLTFASLMR